jgi:hypothetical protein
MRSDWEPLGSADELADTTDASPFGQWFKGVGLAALLAAYAVDCLLTGQATLPSRRLGRFVEFHGLSATALGSLYLCIAAFMHLHWFWTASPRFWGYAQLGKLIAAIGIIASVAVFFFAVLAQ